MFKGKQILILIVMMGGYTALTASMSYSGTSNPDGFAHQDSLPDVFMIGQNELLYEGLVTKCSHPLLTACQDSMDLAYRKWMEMLSNMEQFAEQSEFDIKGIKIWLNVFWDEEGRIDHLVYFPKPNSRNMDFGKLTKFFDKFIGNYKMDKLGSKCYSHYGSATFPTFADLYLNGKE